MSTAKRRDDLFASLKEVSDSVEASPKGKLASIFSYSAKFFVEAYEAAVSVLLQLVAPVYLVLLIYSMASLISAEIDFASGVLRVVLIYILLSRLRLLTGGDENGRRRNYR